jgi:hypothetical protein
MSDAIACNLPSSPNGRFSVMTVDDEIEITDKETRATLVLATLDGGSDVKVFWAPTSDRVLLSVQHGRGFELFGAQLQSRGLGLTKATIPDPGEPLDKLIEDKLESLKTGS